MTGRPEAPLYVDALRTTRWLVENVPPAGVLGPRIHHRALDLCEATTLALGSHNPAPWVGEADEALARLRVLLRVALDTGLLQENGFLHVSRELDGIGRQLGGWLRRLSDPR